MAWSEIGFIIIALGFALDEVRIAAALTSLTALLTCPFSFSG